MEILLGMNDGLIYQKIAEVKQLLKQIQIDCDLLDDILDLLDDIEILSEAKDNALNYMKILSEIKDI